MSLKFPTLDNIVDEIEYTCQYTICKMDLCMDEYRLGWCFLYFNNISNKNICFQVLSCPLTFKQSRYLFIIIFETKSIVSMSM